MVLVQETVERSPKRSLRRRSKIFEFEHVNWQKVIVVDLNKYPYRIQTKEKLTVIDKKDMAEKIAEKNQKFEQVPHSLDFNPQLSSPGVI